MKHFIDNFKLYDEQIIKPAKVKFNTIVEQLHEVPDPSWSKKRKYTKRAIIEAEFWCNEAEKQRMIEIVDDHIVHEMFKEPLSMIKRLYHLVYQEEREEAMVVLGQLEDYLVGK